MRDALQGAGYPCAQLFVTVVGALRQARVSNHGWNGVMF